MQAVEIVGPPRIVLMGVGDAGCNFLDALLCLPGGEQLECMAANTDAAALARSHASTKLHLGTSWAGTGGMISAGRAAAKSSRRTIRNALKHRHFLILVAGLGGGTGTGSTPVIAKIVRKMGIPVIAIVTRPFSFENGRERLARKGLRRLRRQTEAVITVSNDEPGVRRGQDTTFNHMSRLIDKEVINLVRCFTSTILEPSMVNCDLSKVLDWLKGAGELSALCITGTGESALQDVLAAVQAEDGIVARQLDGTRRVFVTITESSALTMSSVRKIVRTIEQYPAPDVFYIYATTSEPDLGIDLRVTMITSRTRYRDKSR